MPKLKISKEQEFFYKVSHETFKNDYINGNAVTKSIDELINTKQRYLTLINVVDVLILSNNIIRRLFIINPNLYKQEIPHITIDSHRKVEDASIELISTNEELEAYCQILDEEVSKESYFPTKLKGLNFGKDGIIIPVYFEYNRMIDFTSSLGEKIRKEVPRFDFEWHLVKDRLPIRAINLARFTGNEDKDTIVKFIEEYKDYYFGLIDIDIVKLVMADKYIQEKKMHIIKSYNFN